MTLEEMTAILFVSPAHMRLLLADGELLVACEIGVDALEIDVTSVTRYQATLGEAWSR
jgi:hypothetical protein